MKIVTFFSLLLPIAGHASPHRTITFTNNCSSPVLVAFTSYVRSIGNIDDKIDRSSYWATEGWLPLEWSKQHKVNIANDRAAAVLIQKKDGTVLTGDEGTFCVHGNAFSNREYAKGGKSHYFVVGFDKTSNQADSCVGAGGHLRRGFQSVDMKDFDNINFNITCGDGVFK